jgi:hypothetical protein
MPVTKTQVKKTGLAFPGALEKPSYGKLAFFIEKKFFFRLREQDNSIAIRVGSIEQRDMMLELDPETYFITAHYKDWPAILVRLAAITPKELKIMLERRWREIAPKKLVREVDGETASAGTVATKTKIAAAPSRRKAPARKPASAKAKAKRLVKAKARPAKV